YTSECGKQNALNIQMSPPPSGPRAVFRLLLYVDSANLITHADLIYGTANTIAQRTVASTPDEIANRFTDYSYRGGRLRLKTKGAYVDSPESTERLTLAWDIALDISVEQHMVSPIRSPSQLDDHQPPPRSPRNSQRYKRRT